MEVMSMIPITKMILTNHNRPGKKIIKLKGVVIHWTANKSKGANAVANRNYFNTTKRACSSHYIIDDAKIIQCIPDSEIAYHVGAPKYTSIGLKIKEGCYTPNFFLIGIEMCVNIYGNWSLVYKNSIQLAAKLLTKYSFTTNDLYRHFDITGKDCPQMLLSESTWNKFKAALEDELIHSSQKSIL
jgi:N-acetylmuramoyl-L-alanine amidase